MLLARSASAHVRSILLDPIDAARPVPFLVRENMLGQLRRKSDAARVLGGPCYQKLEVADLRIERRFRVYKTRFWLRYEHVHNFRSFHVCRPFNPGGKVYIK
jgi:hypothetical protein